jgi:hypothetical protein
MLERRRKRRFPLHQPVLLKIQEDTDRSAIRGISENASESSVLFLTTGEVPPGATVEVRMSMPNGVQLCAVGTVVRTIPGNGKNPAIAVQCMHSFSETLPTAAGGTSVKTG